MSQGSLSSTSSGSSSHQPILMLQKEKDDGSPQVRLGRSGTVRRAPSAKPEPLTAEEEVTLEPPPSELRYRKSLDSSYRRSLESISEYKTKHSFSSASLFLSRDASSVDSSSSDCTDCAMRTAEIAKDKTFVSASSSYLSWIESVNSEYFGSANHSGGDVVDVDAKVGEWNNFWLNYNSNNNRYLSSPYLSISNEEKLEDLSDAKSTTSTQREFTDKQFSLDQIVLSHEEVLETIRCAQRITEVLQNAIKRNESDFDESRNDSYYSHIFPALFSSFRKRDEGPKERVRSYSLEPQELQRQKQMLKPPNQSSNNCINLLLNAGWSDILKRVMNKRKDAANVEETNATPRSSFSDWSSAK